MTRRRPNKHKKLKRDGCEGEAGQTGQPKKPKEGAQSFEQQSKDAHLTTCQDGAAADYISTLSLEMLCRILRFLPVKDIMKLEGFNHTMQEAVTLHLQLLTEIDFCQGKLFGWMPSKFVDETFKSFLQRCREVTFISGLHPRTIVKRRQRGSKSLSIPGIIAGLQTCKKLEGVEISDVFLLEAMMKYLPGVEILGKFRNRYGSFPILNSNRIIIPKNPLITTLHLTGVVIPELPRMVAINDLQLKWVKFTDPHPFREFGIPNLKTFVIRNCAGPPNALKYVPLITGLAAARLLDRIEFVRVPFLGGLIQHVVEDSWRVQGFRQLKKITMGTCKHVLEVDIGYLAITCSSKLEELALQASLTKDSFFASLALAEVVFPKFETLNLGYEDPFPGTEKWTNEELVAMGLADVTENPCSITDIGMKSAGQVFSTTKSLSVYNCPHLHHPTSWFLEGRPSWISLKELHLWRCHAVSLFDFCSALPLFTSLESLFLEQMFREPPKGCSRVGLSAGTGLGVSSALVSNTGAEPANGEAANDDNEDAAVNEDAPQQGPSNQNDDEAERVPVTGNSEAGGGSDSESEDVDNLEPGVVETDGIFYSAPDENSYTGVKSKEDVVSGLSDSRPSNQGPAATAGGTAEECSRNVPTVPITSQEPHDSMSLASVICPGQASCSASMDNVELCDNNSSHSSVDLATEGGNSTLDTKSEQSVSSCNVCQAKAKTTITERKVGNQSVYVVERGKPKCTDHSSTSQGQTSSRVSKLPEGSMSKSTDKPVKDDDMASNASAGQSTDQCDTGCERNSLVQETTCSRKGKSLRGKKKGIVKRSKSKPDPTCGSTRVEPRDGGDSAMVNQSCQAVSEEIRECTKKGATVHQANQKEVTEPEKNGKSKPDKPHAANQNVARSDADSQTAATSPSQPAEGSRVVTPSHSRTRSYRFGPMIGPIGEAIDSDDSASSNVPPSAKKTTKKAVNKKKAVTRDQATSTSDPVIEEDHEQILTIRSSSLVNLTLHQVGVTSLLIGFCSKLKMLSGTACRVLKDVTIEKAPGLVKVSFAQCRKLRLNTVVREVCSLPGDRKRLIFLRPMSTYNMDTMVQCVFQPAGYNYHMCLIHDHSVDPSANLYNQLRASLWPEYFDDISFKLLRLRNVPEAIRENEATASYPWGRHIYPMCGKARDGSSWDMLTDIPWIRPLSEAAVVEPSGDHQFPDHTMCEGLYDPNSRGHYYSFQAATYLEEVTQVSAEYIETGATLYNNCAIVYVNTCDIDKPASPEIFV